MNQIVFYGKVNGDTLETILYKAPIESRMTTVWRLQIESKCRELGATDVRSVEYIGKDQPDFTKILA